MKTSRLLAAALLASAIGGAPITSLAGEVERQPMIFSGIRVPFLHGFFAGESAGQSDLASLERANEWINSPPLTPQALRGKVVLVDFWTYTTLVPTFRQ